MIWQIRDRTLEFGERALLMGILNVTPDSFSDGGRYVSPRNALDHAEEMLAAGADILDVGGESTRPGALPATLEEELDRVIPVIHNVATRFSCVISVDTSKSAVARAAMEAGAHIVNDVTALRGDAAMSDVCASTHAGVILMHMLGNPRTMQRNPIYANVVSDIRSFFLERRGAALRAAIPANALAYDPGIGFGKTVQHNLRLLAQLESLRIDDQPLVAGFSRKSFIASLLGTDAIEARKWPSVALTSLARELGANIIRVHDVRECRDALRVTEALIRA